MLSVVWEPSAGNLLAWLLTNRTAVPVDLWTVTLASGTVYRWSGGDIPRTVAGATYLLGPGLSRDRIRRSIGVSVDDLSVTMLAGPSDLIGSVPVLQAFKRGVFAGSTWRVDRAFFDAAGTCQGVMPGFQGKLGTITRLTRSQAQFAVVSLADALNVQVPSAICQAGCRRTLYDGRCGLTRSAWTLTYTVTAVTDARTFSVTASGNGLVAGWANLGPMLVNTGNNAGLGRVVRSHTVAGSTATFTLSAPLPVALAVGDQVAISAGCDRTVSTCTNKFGNKINFRGEPYVPAPETIT